MLDKGFKSENISVNEMIIIEVLRTLKPFEQLIITADKQGKADNYLLVRSSKVLLTDKETLHTR